MPFVAFEFGRKAVNFIYGLIIRSFFLVRHIDSNQYLKYNIVLLNLNGRGI